MTGSKGLMQGKRGLVMGVANDHSIAYGIARKLGEHGAQLAFTYQGEAILKRVAPLAKELGSELVLPCDAEDIATVDAVFARLREEWGELDFLVHSIAYSDKNELKGLYADTSRQNFIRTLVISCFSFTEAAKRAAAMMKSGGSLLTVTFAGGAHVMPNYNVMGVAKAALDSSVRYLAADFGDRGIRVNAISPGPVRTMAGAGITGARAMGAFQKAHCPLRRMITLDEIGGSALYLLSELSGGVTGEIHLVDAGYNIMLQPRPEDLNGGGE
jgi:enoyl-[acyl-carrier protein] reductase I